MIAVTLVRGGEGAGKGGGQRGQQDDRMMGYSRQGKAARLVPVEAGLLRDRGGQLTARRRTARDCSPRHCDRALSSGPWLPWLVSAASRARRGGVLDFHPVKRRCRDGHRAGKGALARASRACRPSGTNTKQEMHECTKHDMQIQSSK